MVVSERCKKYKLTFSGGNEKENESAKNRQLWTCKIAP